MQEPEIFERPVVSKDPEAHAIGDDNGTYGGTVGTVYSTGLRPTVGEDVDSEDYRDFVYPEGWFCLLPPARRVRCDEALRSDMEPCRQEIRHMVNRISDYQPRSWSRDLFNTSAYYILP